MRLLPLLTSLFLASGSVPAAEGWRDQSGKAIPDSANAKSKDGFAAMVLITPDKDWQEKWNTPPEVAPHFSEAAEVFADGELHILTFLANPQLDPTGRASVSCDFVIIRPDGTDSIRELGFPCFETELKTNPQNVYMSTASLKYIAEPSDPKGTWTVSVVVRDTVRNVEIPLQHSFVVK